MAKQFILDTNTPLGNYRLISLAEGDGPKDENDTCGAINTRSVGKIITLSDIYGTYRCDDEESVLLFDAILETID